LHMGLGPQFTSSDIFYGLERPYYGGSIPILGLIDLWGGYLPVWMIQKGIFFSVLFLSGVSTHLLLKGQPTLARYFAGVLYMANPFTYSRLVVGDLQLLLGYAVAPLAIKAWLYFLQRANLRRLLFSVLFLALVGVFSSHVFVLVCLTFGILLAVSLWSEPRETRGHVLRRFIPLTLLFIGISVVINAYWLIPILGARESPWDRMGKQDLKLFNAQTLHINPLITVFSMHGYWRDPPFAKEEIFPLQHWFFIIFLFLAVHALLASRDPHRWSMFSLILILTFLASGINGPLRGLIEELHLHIPILRAFRDSHKFLALLPLSYGYLGALSIGILWQEILANAKARFLPMSPGLLAVFLVLAYSANLFKLPAQLGVSEYPEAWHETFHLVKERKGNLLVLPWHWYMTFGWISNIDKSVVNPAEAFYGKPIVVARNLEVPSLYTESQNPGQLHLDALIASMLKPDSRIQDFGKRLLPLNIQYVVLFKDTDYEQYKSLYDQKDLKLIQDNATLALFQNTWEVSQLYTTDQPDDPGTFVPLYYERKSMIRYEVELPKMRYVVFVPPNLDYAGWEADGLRVVDKGKGYVVYESMSGQTTPIIVYYAPFNWILSTYIVSLLSLILIGGVLSIPSRFSKE